MARTFSCRECGATGFNSGGAVAKHRHDEHTNGTTSKPAKRRKKPAKAGAVRRRRKRRQAVELVAVEARGSEGRCLQVCMDSFEDDGLDDDARKRILDHLWARFYPAGTEEEEAA